MTHAVDRPDAIVMGQSVTSLGIARSLALADIRSILISGSPIDPAPKSRFVRASHTVGRLDDATIMAILDRYRGAGHVLIAASDIFVDFVSRNEAQLRDDFHFIAPAPHIVAMVNNKATETERIRELGFPLPKTIACLPDDPAALRAALGLPIIVKPRTDVVGRAMGKKNFLIATEDELDQFYIDHRADLNRVIAQEVVPGDDDRLWVCNCTFDRQHKLLNAFTFNRLGTTPAHYGVTSFAVSSKNEQVVDYVRQLGAALNYSGPAMFEFKFDQRDGHYKFIELNPRLGMCNFFDTTCGINNALATYELSRLGEAGDAEFVDEFQRHEQRDNIVYVDFLRDLIARWSTDESWPHIVARYLAFALYRKVRPLWFLSDPAPAVFALMHHVLAGVL